MTRALGTTGLQLTELGFGGAGIGGLYVPVGREAAMEAMQAAWDAGMRYFDTAPFYGFGLSERRVGDFLRQVGLCLVDQGRQTVARCAQASGA